MNYLKEYGITDEQIESIDKHFTEVYETPDVLLFEVEKVKEILDIFKSSGINNIYDVIITGSDMFFDTVESVKRRFNSYQNKEELVNLINEDANNLKLVDLI